MTDFRGDVAIIGMACIFPCAPDLRTYWQNILSKAEAFTEPPQGWGMENIRGGFLGNLAEFNPLEYGIMPSSVDGGDPDHFLALRVAHEALSDANYLKRSFDRECCAVIMGMGKYVTRGNTNWIQHGVIVDQTVKLLKQLHPEYTEEKLKTIREELKASLPPFNAEVAPSLIPNIVTGRIANRLGLMGPNYVVDAACASSLIAVEMGVQNLLTRKCDLAIVGGVNTTISPPIFMIFQHLNALSQKGQIRPFDINADGTMLGEGVGMVVLKRREDAERNGDRIYAVIKGIGIASDGRALGLLAPRLEGEELALRRAYEASGISPHTVELIEAHGTGMQLGDVTEIQALSRVFGQRNGDYPSCAVGSVKSMIGHLIPAAGIAGLIKTALALYHKILPPTISCDTPNPKLNLEKTPFYVNTEPRPWIHGGYQPRRAGVNAFGFGGINAHVLLEEYNEQQGRDVQSFLHKWDTEVYIIQGESRHDLIRMGERVLRFVSTNPELELKDLAYTLNCPLQKTGYRLAIVASSVKDLEKSLAHGLKRLSDPECTKIKDQNGIFFFEEPAGIEGSIAFLFPGEGSEYINMLSDLCFHFPEVRKCFDRMDRVFIDSKRDTLPSQILFPPPPGHQPNDKSAVQGPWEMDFAITAVFAADHALFTLLDRIGIRPNAIVGHSSGEFAAFLASGIVEALDDDSIIQYSYGLNRIYKSIRGRVPGARFITVGGAELSSVTSLINKNAGSLYITMDNCPNQIILCGTEDAILRSTEILQSQGAICNPLPLDRAYHTPLFQSVCDEFYSFFKGLRIVSPGTTLYSCATAQPYPQDPEEIRRLAVEQWARPVRFSDTIRAMYDAGVRVFIEVGARGNLTTFVNDILKGNKYLAVPSNIPHRSGIAQLNFMIGLLAAHGVQMSLDYLYERRVPRKLNLETAQDSSARAVNRNEAMRLNLELPRLKLSKQVSDISTIQKDSNQVGERQTGSRAAVMQEYMRSMERFVDLQHELMTAFIARKKMIPPASDKIAGSDSSSLPFSIKTTSIIPGKEVIATCRLDMGEDLFLRDHTLGRNVSANDHTLFGLCVVPLTISVEIMAQVSALLAPGKRLVSIKGMRAYRWIIVEEMVGRNLMLIAKFKGRGKSEGIEVRIMEDEKVENSELGNNHILAEGTFIFADEYPDPPEIKMVTYKSQGPFRFRPDQFYREILFLGPAFQSILSIDRSGEDGAEATLTVPSGVRMFRSNDNNRFLTNPVLIDGAGQVIGAWAQAHLESGFVAFPTGFEALYLYRQWPSNPASVKCLAGISLLSDGRIHSDIDLVSDGEMLARLVAWDDMRFFDWTRRYIQLTLSTRTTMLSTVYPQLITPFPSSLGLRCCRISGAADGIWMQILANLTLNRQERKVYSGLSGPEKRRKEWLLGRVAAKDAARLYLKDHYQLDVYPADIEIITDVHGQPVVGGGLIQEIGCNLSLSIAHAMGGAIGAVCDSDKHFVVGIDMEHISRCHEGLYSVILTAEEQDILSVIPPLDREEWLLRLWCAKESVSKALGRGMIGGPLNLTVQKIDVETTGVSLVLTGEMARQMPAYAHTTFMAHTTRNEDFVFAISLVNSL